MSTFTSFIPISSSSEEEEHLELPAFLDSLENLQQSVPESRLTPTNSSSAEGLPLQFGEYVVLKFLGEGAYGKVAKCTNSKTGEVVALKIFENDEGDMEKELEILQHLKHIDPEEANLVRCMDHFTCGRYKCVAYQLLDCSLADMVVQRRIYLSLNELRPIAQQLLVAFNALNDAQVVHTDLRADNIMLVNHQEQPFKVKLIDFGCAYPKSELELGTIIQPEAYRAPEVTLAAPLSEAVDMWSLGCCLAEGFLGCELFSESSSYDHIRTIVHLLGQPSDEVLNRGFHSYQYFEQINGQWRFKSPLRYKATNRVSPKVIKMPLDHVPNLSEALMFETSQLEPDEHLDRLAFLDFITNLLQTDPEKRLTPGEALRHPFITIDHLTQPSPYLQHAHDLMTFTLKSSNEVDMKRSTFTISSNSSSNFSSNCSSNSSSNSSSSEDLPLQFGEYVVLKFLGKGAYGKVAKCTNSKTGEVVALKFFENDEGDMQRELEILQHLKDIEPEEANLVRCVDQFTCGKYKCIAYQLLDCSLADMVVQQRRYFSLNELRPIAQQLLVAFNALKDAQVIHTDLKADNIMLVNHQEQPFKVKLIDFGCGYHKSELELGTIIQPEAYRAPEVTLAAPLSEAVDMWSLGCCLAEGFLGCELFSESSSYDHIRTIVHLLGQPSDEVLNRGFHSYQYFEQINGQWRLKTPLRYKATNQVSPKVVKMPLDHVPNLSEALMFETSQLEPDEHLDRLAFLDFITNLLQTDPEKRLTPGEALRHPFITIDHLTQPSPYLQHAHDLMTFTLKTSSDKGELENKSSQQNPQPLVPQTENDFLGFGDQLFPPEVIHRETCAIPQTEEAKISKEGFMNHFVDATFTVNPHRDEEPLSCVIEMDQIIENLNLSTTSSTSIEELDTAEAPPEHVVINMEDCPEDVFSEPADRKERSASFRSTMKRVAFYGVVMFQALACYLLTGSFVLSALMLLPILFYRCRKMLTVKMNSLIFNKPADSRHTNDQQTSPPPGGAKGDSGHLSLTT